MPTRVPFIGGNWKMHLNLEAASSLVHALADSFHHPHYPHSSSTAAEIAVFPPFPYLLPLADILQDRGSSILLGAQDFYPAADGPFTGEVSLAMLRDCGVSIVLTGHSERRHVIGESDDLVRAKTAAALAAGFRCVLCVGERLDEREAGRAHAVNERQLRLGLAGVPAEHLERLVIAYEPVWAIGTGRTATPADAEEAHHEIRGVLASFYSREAAERVRVIYGGSLRAANAADLFAQPDIDGGLVGGASLNAAEFAAIVKATAAASCRSTPTGSP